MTTLNQVRTYKRIPKESQVQELVDLLGIGMKNNLKIIIATTEEQ